MELFAKGQTISFSDRPLLMGIVNVTPDSFFDGGRFLDPQAAVAHAWRLVEEGADLLDIGAESTRPGSVPVEETEERRRLIPVVTAVAKAAGGYALIQHYSPMDIHFDMVQSAEDVIIVGRSKEALDVYRHDFRWQLPDAGGVKPWTDDYTNLVSAMVRRLHERYPWL